MSFAFFGPVFVRIRIRLIAIHEDSMRRAFEIVELSAFYRPEERPTDHAGEHHREQHEQIDHFHSLEMSEVLGVKSKA